MRCAKRSDQWRLICLLARDVSRNHIVTRKLVRIIRNMLRTASELHPMIDATWANMWKPTSLTRATGSTFPATVGTLPDIPVRARRAGY